MRGPDEYSSKQIEFIDWFRTDEACERRNAVLPTRAAIRSSCPRLLDGHRVRHIKTDLSKPDTPLLVLTDQ